MKTQFGTRFGGGSGTRAPHSTIKIIGAASALGAPHAGTAAGPSALQAGPLASHLRALGLAVEWLATLSPLATDTAAGADQADMTTRIAANAAFAARLADHLGALPPAHFPLVIGGDHAVAAGTWRGIGRRRGRAPGLIWIDAHLDSHTDASTHSGNIHGMPLAALLGAGHPALCAIPGPDLDPARTCIIGARAWEPEEQALLARFGVRVFDMAEVNARGLPTVFCEAMTIARADPDAGFGLSLDLDAIDPQGLPAVTCPEAAGIDPRALADCLLGLRACADLVGLEIVEYRPDLDADGRSARWVVEFAAAALGPSSAWLRDKESRYGAANYAPLPAVFQRGEGVWLWDTEGRRYLDMMSAYSAVSFGHSHPRLVGALIDQAQRLALTSRAFSSDRLPVFLERLCATFGYARALPVNTGLEAVETALKAARKWGYQVKGIAPERVRIIACDGNFHGRSIAIVGLSSNPHYRDGFGPFPPGLERVPFGDTDALEAAITPDTAAFLVEPIQGEGGIVVPPAGYLSRCAEICRRHGVLLIADEVQTGLGRCGRLLACDHEGVRPDGLILGKALGGGLLPVSAFLADRALMDVFRPGDHGSTFGGNPLAAAVGTEVLALLEDTRPWERAERLGTRLMDALRAAALPGVVDIRGRGLLVGLAFDPALADAGELAERLLARGIATRDTNGNVIRLAPPLIIDEDTLEAAIEGIVTTLRQSVAERGAAGPTGAVANLQ
ncbi:MAG TPA: ornithine--oxo-acid transaminase [Thauera sp.]|uniref:ornithine--oxo-acid transaminase n=1 Tax=Thauera sp. TaxID=1905334 RepID=UPI002CE256D9|nr:ornithine--oxo-acid transaminase [Thauera sp.]HRP22401.1 ornithine--oxo-acid transaminase [Thauera sp.]HRP65315.1 ornithine--oxo-acid transaminase [Thauera sp.]